MKSVNEGFERLKDLMALAIRTGFLEGPTGPAAGIATESGEKTLGVVKAIGGLAGGAIASLAGQASPQSGGVSWLKWMNPIAGLISLFTGGQREEDPIAPVMSPRQPKRYLEYGVLASRGGEFSQVDKDEDGRTRLATPQQAAEPSVVVQVQAMDSSSFLDHRDAIASAVKQALMESHGLGTVLGEFRE